MPDVQQIGGVTGWLRAAAIAQAAGKPMSIYLFIEASAHLMAMTPLVTGSSTSTWPARCWGPA